MAHTYIDTDTGIKHIRIEDADIALCGLMEGWTDENDEPHKERYGSTCGNCIDEIQRIKKLKFKGKRKNLR